MIARALHQSENHTATEHDIFNCVGWRVKNLVVRWKQVIRVNLSRNSEFINVTASDKTSVEWTLEESSVNEIRGLGPMSTERIASLINDAGENPSRDQGELVTQRAREADKNGVLLTGTEPRRATCGRTLVQFSSLTSRTTSRGHEQSHCANDGFMKFKQKQVWLKSTVPEVEATRASSWRGVGRRCRPSSWNLGSACKR